MVLSDCANLASCYNQHMKHERTLHTLPDGSYIEVDGRVLIIRELKYVGPCMHPKKHIGECRCHIHYGYSFGEMLNSKYVNIELA